MICILTTYNYPNDRGRKAVWLERMKFQRERDVIKEGWIIQLM